MTILFFCLLLLLLPPPHFSQAPPDPGLPTESNAAAEPPAEKKADAIYVVPYYPLPPTPTLSPPSTMPFAYIDWEHENAFTPPSLTVLSASEAGLEAGSEAPLGLAADDVLPYQAPPMPESESGIQHVWRQHAGSGDNRLDSVNPVRLRNASVCLFSPLHQSFGSPLFFFSSPSVLSILPSLYDNSNVGIR